MSLEVGVNTMIAKSVVVMARLNKRVLDNNHLTKNIKLRLYQACVLSTLLYGSETWTTYASQEKNPNSCHLRCLRRLLHVRWQDKVTNSGILKHAGIPSLYKDASAGWDTFGGRILVEFQMTYCTESSLKECDQWGAPSPRYGHLQET